MGQEQSYVHANGPVRRYKNKYEDPVQYRNSIDCRKSEYESKEYEYIRQKARRSADSFKSDHSTESSGYRSGSSACECRSEVSSKSGYYGTSLYKNDHYKDANKDIYKPVKLPKEKRYRNQLIQLQKDELKSARLMSYLDESDKGQFKTGSSKKSGIRNYTPKILSEEEQKGKLDWS
ncbi:uncharacterized protein LOC114252891 [Bombyx mandarina]|uniref:Uncharacterized protein n=2 Tax=Bombyx TaxID=7090 RepID=A0A8R1WLA4_BOMMO|nr:uncharacterized protein LOC101741255 [Bombyx mori]XP_012548170.1 uncharacterized protein LOC101741255 [Bombyx mori]XP_028043371.1 uncharacterized protein LOC114252891 [Bombyx mandarina]